MKCGLLCAGRCACSSVWPSNGKKPNAAARSTVCSSLLKCCDPKTKDGRPNSTSERARHGHRSRHPRHHRQPVHQLLAQRCPQSRIEERPHKRRARRRTAGLPIVPTRPGTNGECRGLDGGAAGAGGGDLSVFVVIGLPATLRLSERLDLTARDQGRLK